MNKKKSAFFVFRGEMFLIFVYNNIGYHPI